MTQMHVAAAMYAVAKRKNEHSPCFKRPLVSEVSMSTETAPEVRETNEV